MSDGIGISIFLNALAEIARGASKPTILPVWCREILSTRDPPKIARVHNEYKQLEPDNKSIFEPYHRSFFFGPSEISAIRALLPQHLAQNSTSFEVLTAFIWRCRTKALQWENQDQEVRLLCIVNARFGKCTFNPPLPKGYYGNAFVFPAAVTTVGKLCNEPIEYALELVKKAKGDATEEYVHSVVDLLGSQGRPCFTTLGSFMISDLSKAALKDVDFGWGKALFAGVAKCGLDCTPGVSFYCPLTNSKGEHGRVLVIGLPRDAMDRFAKEVDDMLRLKI